MLDVGYWHEYRWAFPNLVDFLDHLCSIVCSVNDAVTLDSEKTALKRETKPYLFMFVLFSLPALPPRAFAAYNH